MKTETKEIYKCEHCNKLYQIKNACLSHEKTCSKNPDNDRACFGCIHLSKESETIYYDTFYGEGERKVDLLHCNKLETFLYPPKVEHKGNMYETDSKENNPMPKSCKLYDDGNTRH
jgi:hypothetical protein